MHASGQYPGTATGLAVPGRPRQPAGAAVNAAQDANIGELVGGKPIHRYYFAFSRRKVE